MHQHAHNHVANQNACMLPSSPIMTACWSLLLQGLVLGHQGRTIQQIQQTTGARVEIHSKQGNLNGDHPIATDPTLHAKIIASNEVGAAVAAARAWACICSHSSASELQDSLEEATRFVARLLEPVNAEHEEFEVTPGGSAVLVAVPKQHAESKRQAKQQRKASLRAEQELQRAFNHRRSHSIDSGNSLISETVHMSTSSLTADTEADIVSIAESESPFAHPLPDHHNSADGGPAWISPAGPQPTQVLELLATLHVWSEASSMHGNHACQVTVQVSWSMLTHADGELIRMTNLTHKSKQH